MLVQRACKVTKDEQGPCGRGTSKATLELSRAEPHDDHH